jgi:hypothetical protein
MTMALTEDKLLQFIYFSLVRQFKVTHYLSIYPSYASSFRYYSLQYDKYVNDLYKMYVSRYITRRCKYVKKKFVKHTHYIHNNIYIPSLKDSYKKTKITKDIIKSYLENLDISELIYYLRK